MDSIVITLQLPQAQRELNVELPVDLPCTKLLPALVQATGAPRLDGARRPLRYQLAVLREGQAYPLRERDSLAYAGVLAGNTLILTGGDTGVAVYAPAQNNSAVLCCPSGTIIALENFGKPELLIGRYDATTGKYPDIELSEEPGGNTISRKHALLRKQGAAWYIVPLTPRNITQLQKARLTAQQSYLLQDGQELLLGRVPLRFHSTPP